MRYIIFGAGAVGGTIAACLFEAGHRVVVIARGEHGRILTENGLTFGTPAGVRTLRIPVAGHPGALSYGSDDVVILAMKSQDTSAALDALSRVAPPDVPVVCAQNGVANERRALRLFSNVHGARVMMAAMHVEPGRVYAHTTPYSGSCNVGRYPRGSDRLDAELASVLTAANVHSVAYDDIMPLKYDKLLFNLDNVVEAACGDRPGREAISARARAEAEAVYAAAGIASSSGDPADRPPTRFGTIPGVPRVGSSTLQSLLRGASSLEVNDLNGEIVLLGRLHGVPTPVNAALQRLGIDLQERRVAPESVSPEALEERIRRAR